MPNRALFHIDRFNSERFRQPDSFHFQDEFSIDSKDSSSPARYFPYETPSSVNSPESGFSEGLFPRRYPPIAVPRLPEESDSNSQEPGGTEESGDKVKQEEVTNSPVNIEAPVKQETAEENSENLELTAKIETAEDTISSDNMLISVKQESTEDNSDTMENPIKQEVSENSFNNRTEVPVKQEITKDTSIEDEASNEELICSNTNKVIPKTEVKEEVRSEEMDLHDGKVEVAEKKLVIESADTESTVIDSSSLVQETLVDSIKCQGDEEKLEDSDKHTTEEPTKD